MVPNPKLPSTGKASARTLRRRKLQKKGQRIEKNAEMLPIRMARSLIADTPLEENFMTLSPNVGLENYQNFCNSCPSVKIEIPHENQPLSHSQMNHIIKKGKEDTKIK